jgi:hypothetical protein
MKTTLEFRRVEIKDVITASPMRHIKKMHKSGWTLESVDQKPVRGLCESCGCVVFWKEKFLDYGDCIDCKKCASFAHRA